MKRRLQTLAILAVFSAPVAASDLAIFDSNGDGVINPYEALDVLLTAQAEGSSLSVGQLLQRAEEQRIDTRLEMRELLSWLDDNRDGVTEVDETGDEEAEEFLTAMDGNRDGRVTLPEAMRFNFNAYALDDEREVEKSVREAFAELDEDRDGRLDLRREVEDDDFNEFRAADTDRDGQISRAEGRRYLLAENTQASFTVKGNVAYMSGVITAELPARVLQLLHEHPQVDTVEMGIVPGSLDDEANLRAARYLHAHNIRTRLASGSMVASGGVDFFLAGTQRHIAKGALVGVHAWSDGFNSATDLADDDPAHQSYLDFYKTVGIDPQFYWYTLDAAPADDMHWMTDDELRRFSIATQ